MLSNTRPLVWRVRLRLVQPPSPFVGPSITAVTSATFHQAILRVLALSAGSITLLQQTWTMVLLDVGPAMLLANQSNPVFIKLLLQVCVFFSSSMLFYRCDTHEILLNYSVNQYSTHATSE